MSLESFMNAWKALATALRESPAQPGRLHSGAAAALFRIAAHR